MGAILCLQSDLCHEALQIEWPAIRKRAIEQGIAIARVAVRDFDHNDQEWDCPLSVEQASLFITMCSLVKTALSTRSSK